MANVFACDRCRKIVETSGSHWFIDKTYGITHRYYEFCDECYDDFLNNWVKNGVTIGTCVTCTDGEDDE